MRLGFLFFICFGFYWEDQEFFVGSMAKLAEKAASTIVQSMWQETHPCWRIPEKVWRNWLSWIMHRSRLDLDMMHSWKESSHCRTGVMFLPSVTEFHHKKNYSRSWYLVCLYAHGMVSLNCSDDEIEETNCLDCEYGAGIFSCHEHQWMQTHQS